MWQRKQGLEVSYPPSTFHTATSSHSSSSNASAPRRDWDVPFCFLGLFWAAGGGRERDQKNFGLTKGQAEPTSRGLVRSLKKNLLLQSFTSGQTEQGQPEQPFIPFLYAHSR